MPRRHSSPALPAPSIRITDADFEEDARVLVPVRRVEARVQSNNPEGLVATIAIEDLIHRADMVESRRPGGVALAINVVGENDNDTGEILLFTDIGTVRAIAKALNATIRKATERGIIGAVSAPAAAEIVS